MRSELFINGTVVDLKSEFGCAITYAISDIKKPETRNGSYSKTVTLPGTKTINALLTHIYDVNYDIQTSGIVNFVPDFNPNLKASVHVYTDGLLQFTGYMRLMNIVRSQADLQRMDYEVTLIGEVSTIYQVMSDNKLSDIDLSSLNHTYSKSVQKATWTNTNYGDGYVYPMINYGGVVANSWDVNNFYPAVYAKTIVDAIFSDAGWVYDSTFFDSAFFKRMIIPYAGDKFTVTADQASDRYFSSSLSTIITDSITLAPATTIVSQTEDPVIFDTELSDPTNQYNPATGYFTAANSGYYEFYSSGVCKATATSNCVFASLQSCQVTIQVKTTGSSTATYPVAGTGNFQTSTTTVSTGVDIYSKTLSGVTQTFYMQAGDTARVSVLQTMSFNMGSTGDFDFSISAGSVFFNRITNTQIVDGNALDMASWLPTDIRQADFLTSIFRTFNLYVEPDRSQPNKLKIETEPNFYESGTTRDWTLKLDVSRPFTSTPMGALDWLRYKVKYADDTDYWNKLYKDKFKETYGEKNVDVVNDFLKNTSVNEVIFAATPLIGSASHDRIIPEIYTLTNAGVQQPVRSKLRLLYWGGALNTVTGWTYTSAISGSSAETVYPYAGHLDNPYSPTVDLSFGVPREIYFANPYGTTTYTNNNLYNQYHSVYIEEITDRNSKIVTGHFRLNPLDIFKLSFRDIIYIDGQNYRLNKVIDYDPTSASVTKVELLKIKRVPAFEFSLLNLTFTFGETIGRDSAPGHGGNVGAGDLDNSSSNLTVGRDNYISETGTGISVSGNSNRIGNNTYNCSVFNSSGVCISDGCQNVSVIGTNNITITESNVSYLNGIRISGDAEWNTLGATQTISDTGKYLVSTAITITLTPSALRSGDRFVFKKTDSGTTTTISGGGVNIDGAATTTLTTQYQSVTIEYDGTQFYIV